jgi:CRP/FNR family transcriptional regulator, anaerobic regulatory protein
MDWTLQTEGLTGLTGAQHARLAALPVQTLPQGLALFHAGDRAAGFLVILSGRVEVFLTGPSGREILLYAVEPGQSCVQTTLGLLGDEDYAGEAVTATDCRAVMIPRALFLTLMDEAPGFRRFVFRAFGQRMQGMTRLLEQVAFQRVESRLAAALLHLATGTEVEATQSDLAARIGSAREVVSRRLEAMVRKGLVSTERGRVHLIDPKGLERLAKDTTDGRDLW